jgi:hypothetical protein
MKRTIKIHIEKLPESVCLATSDDVQGLAARGRTVAETLEIARDVARKLIEAQTQVSLPPLADQFDYPQIISVNQPWAGWPGSDTRRSPKSCADLDSPFTDMPQIATRFGIIRLPISFLLFQTIPVTLQKELCGQSSGSQPLIQMTSCRNNGKYYRQRFWNFRLCIQQGTFCPPIRAIA